MGIGRTLCLIVILSILTTITLAESDLKNSNGSLILNQYYYGNPSSQIDSGCNYINEQNISFLTTVSVFLGVYGLLIAIFLGIGWFLNYKEIKGLKESVSKELKKDFSDKAQTIIRETMKSCYDDPINEAKEGVTKLENYVKDLKKSIETQQPIPDYPEDNDNNEEKDKNVFDEP